MKRIYGIDSIRFICAMFVVLGHIGVPIPNFIADFHSLPMKIINSLLWNTFNGPAAVIVFFVISGFCIHFPFREGQFPSLLPYYSRRIIRICLPAIAGVGLFLYFRLELKPPSYTIFWSVICEIIYYAIYPILLLLKKFLGWKKMIFVTYIVSVLLGLTHLEELTLEGGSYVALGSMTWLTGLPCWLLGCWLAENYSRFSVLPSRQIWLLRVSVFVISIILRIIKFHVLSAFGSNVFTLNIFAFLVCLWIGYEIKYYQLNKPSVVLEKAGKWSYSLYLTHECALPIIALVGIVGLSTLGMKIILIVSALVLAYIFYLLIEKPSHRFAVYVSQKLARSPIVHPVS